MTWVEKSYSEFIESQSMCLFPWLALYFWAFGEVNLCCNFENEKIFSISEAINTKESSIWNHEKIQQIRKKLLNGERVDYCSKCYKEESLGIKSLRKRSFEVPYYFFGISDLSDISKLILSTKDNGALSYGPKYLDIRFSNLCNLACIMCSSFSSSKRQIIDQKIIQGPITPYSGEIWADTKEMQILLNHSQNLETLYIAWGEPFITKSHWKYLSELIQDSLAPNINLVYHSNLTILPWHFNAPLPISGYPDIFSIWKHFKRVTVLASADGFGDTYNNIRIWGDWNIFSRNALLLQKAGYLGEIAITVQRGNIFNFPKLLLWCFAHWLKVRSKILYQPDYLDIRHAPAEERKKIAIFYTEILGKYPNLYEKLSENLNMVMDYLQKTSADSKKNTEYIRNEKIFDSFRNDNI